MTQEKTNAEPLQTSNEYIISLEVAQEQMDKFLTYYDIDVEELDHGDQKTAVEQTIKKLIKMIRRGFVQMDVVDSSCTVKHTTRDGKTIVYKELTGLHKAEMGKRKVDDQNAKVYTLMGSLSGEGYAVIARLKSRDLTIAECLGILFLLV